MTAEVRFLPSGRRLRVPLGTTLLAAARRAGLPVASACGASGLCARCGVRVHEGAAGLSPESEDEARAKRRNRIPATWRLACQARMGGDAAVSASYW